MSNLGDLERALRDLHERAHDGALPIENVVEALQTILRGGFRVVPKPSGRIIDCSAKPFIPEGWSIRRRDQIKNRITNERFKFDPTEIGLHLGGWNTLKGRQVLPANVLDHLLTYPDLIPDSWGRTEPDNPHYQCIFFWGTIYRNPKNVQCVRYLYRTKRGWRWGWFPCEKSGKYPVAIKY